MHLSKYSLKGISLLTLRYSRTAIIIIASVLVLAIAISTALYNIKPAHAATPPDSCFSWTVSGTNATITNYYNHEGNNSANPACPKDVNIPSTLNNGTLTVTAIGASNFGTNNSFHNRQLTSVTIPSTVTTIGNSAFSSNQLTSLTFDASSQLTSIGNSAFFYNQLTTLTIPNTVTSIGSNAFAYNQLASITIHNASATMQHNSFVNNPISTMTIGSTTYTEQVPTTEPACFVMSGTTVTNYHQVSPLIARNNGVLCGRDITIPNSVTSIGDYAFYFNQLTSITIPSTVTSIGNGAFSSNQLTSLTFDASSQLTSIGDYAFSFNQLTSLTIPNTVTSIGNSAFSSNQLTSLTIPNTVTSIGNYAFFSNQLTTLTFDASSQLTSIGNYAFYSNQLTTLTIPNTVTSIGNSAFYSNQLTSLTIPNTVTSIGNWAFSYNQLTTLTFGSNLTTIPEGAFTANKLISVTIPSSVTSIHPTAFFEQNPVGGDMENDRTSPFYIWSNDPSIVQAAYNSIWYVALYTEDPSNPNNLQPGFVSEDWWQGWDANSNGHTRDSLGGHLINPASTTINYTSSSNHTLRQSITYTGRNTDNSYITSYLAKDNPFPVPLDPENPTTEELADQQEGLIRYFSLGEEITITPDDIEDYLTPSSKTVTLTEPTNQLTFTYKPVIKSVPFKNHQVVESGQLVTDSTPPSDVHHPIITDSSLSIDQAGDCQAIEQAKLLSPTSLDTNPNTPAGSKAKQVIGDDITILGGLDFTLINCVSGGQNNITYTLGQALTNPEQDLRIYKHNPTALNPDQQFEDITDLVTFSTQNNKTVLSYSLTDGGQLDQDNTANGMITDPIYIGITTSSLTELNTTNPTNPTSSVRDAISSGLANTGDSLKLIALLAGGVMVAGLVGLGVNVVVRKIRG